MKIIFCFLLVISTITVNLFAQAETLANTIKTVDSFFGDTLQFNTGQKIVIGQKLMVGKGSDDNGWYSSMQFKNPFNWSLLLFRNAQSSNNPNSGKVDIAQEYERNKLRDFFYEGDSVLVEKIKREGNKKNGFWYIVYLKTCKFPKAKFICNIELAVKNKEIIIE